MQRKAEEQLLHCAITDIAAVLHTFEFHFGYAGIGLCGCGTHVIAQAHHAQNATARNRGLTVNRLRAGMENHQVGGILRQLFDHGTLLPPGEFY